MKLKPNDLKESETKRIQSLTKESHGIIDTALEEYSPSKLFSMFSGGHDSRATLIVASMHPAFTGVGHVNTGIGIPQTREYVKNTCNDIGCKLYEYYAGVKYSKTAKSYEEMILEHGFPGPGAHKLAYSWLKERPIRGMIKEQKTSRFDHVGLITGVRLQESSRRMGHVEPIKKSDPNYG